MSAIAGIFFFNGAPVEPGLIEKITIAQRSRGPDEQTHWLHGSVALGHCMLRTTTESLDEHQPLAGPGKNNVLVWDGRLDNREELKRELSAAGFFPRDNSDAELVLQSYELWGKECPKRLLGDFAFAVWDARVNHLFCTRDQLGAKPFSYVNNSRYFAFASSEEALLKLPGVSSKPNDDHIASLLMPDFNDMETWQGWMRDVWGLPNGQTMTISADGKITKETYWDLVPRQETTYDSDEECVDAFLEVFSKAVSCRLRQTGEPAVMMSGGMDSASVMAMLRRLLPDTGYKEIHSYSVVSDDPTDCIESRCIHSLIKGPEIDPNFMYVPSFSGIANMEDLKQLAWGRAHPVENSILVPAMMYLSAGRLGDRVILHGACGDITTQIPNRYVANFLRRGQWQKAWAECRTAFPDVPYFGTHGPLATFLLNSWTAFVPETGKLPMRYVRSKMRGSSRTGSLIKPEFASRLQLVDRIRDQNTRSARAFGTTSKHAETRSRMSYIVSAQSASGRAAQRAGVEPRDPWADRRLVEFFLTLPLEFKVRNGARKYLVRAAFKSDLEPVVLQRRSKEHLGWNVKVGLMAASSDMISEVFENCLESMADYVDAVAARARYEQYLTSFNPDAIEAMFDFLTLALWLDRISAQKTIQAKIAESWGTPK